MVDGITANQQFIVRVLHEVERPSAREKIVVEKLLNTVGKSSYGNIPKFFKGRDCIVARTFLYRSQEGDLGETLSIFIDNEIATDMNATKYWTRSDLDKKRERLISDIEEQLGISVYKVRLSREKKYCLVSEWQHEDSYDKWMLIENTGITAQTLALENKRLKRRLKSMLAIADSLPSEQRELFANVTESP